MNTPLLDNANEEESLKIDFLKRMVWFENYYKRLSVNKESTFYSNWQAMNTINSYLKEEGLSASTVKKAIKVYNLTDSRKHHDGSGWYDLKLQLRGIACVFGLSFESDTKLNLIKKENL